jgi:hypothetical protein
MVEPSGEPASGDLNRADGVGEALYRDRDFECRSPCSSSWLVFNVDKRLTHRRARTDSSLPIPTPCRSEIIYPPRSSRSNSLRRWTPLGRRYRRSFDAG